MAINKMAGTLAVYAHLILHSALAFSLRDSRSRAAVERIGTKLHKQMNHRETNMLKSKNV